MFHSYLSYQHLYFLLILAKIILTVTLDYTLFFMILIYVNLEGKTSYISSYVQWDIVMYIKGKWKVTPLNPKVSNTILQ